MLGGAAHPAMRRLPRGDDRRQHGHVIAWPIVAQAVDEDRRRPVHAVPHPPAEIQPDLGEVHVLFHLQTEARHVQADRHRAGAQSVVRELRLMRRRDASINDYRIDESERRIL